MLKPKKKSVKKRAKKIDDGFRHIVQKDDRLFVPKSYLTVPIEKTYYEGKYRLHGVRAVIGKLRKCKEKCFQIQKLLVPKIYFDKNLFPKY